MADQPYSNRELDRMFKEIKEQLDRIEVQTTESNHRLNIHDRILLVAGVAASILLFFKAPELLGLAKTLLL